MDELTASMYLQKVVHALICHNCGGWRHGYVAGLVRESAIPTPDVDFYLEAWPVASYRDDKTGEELHYDDDEDYDNAASFNFANFTEAADPHDVATFHLDDTSVTIIWRNDDLVAFGLELFFAPRSDDGSQSALEILEQALGGSDEYVVSYNLAAPGSGSYNPSMLCDALVLVGKHADEAELQQWQEKERLAAAEWVMAELAWLSEDLENNVPMPKRVDELEDI